MPEPYLKNIKLSNFRSYKGRGFNFSKNTNLIVGPNGSGKTNILEAIYLIGMSKGFRGSSQQMCRGDSGWFRVEAQFNGEKVAISYKNEQKKIVLGDTPLTPQEYLGTIPIVLFEPSTLSLIDGAPQLRRQWVDRILSQTNKEYLRSLIKYRQVLKQRNNLLRKIKNSNGNTSLKQQVFAWDVIMSEYAEYIVVKRLELINEIAPKVTKYYHDISSSKDQIKLHYKSNIDTQSGVDKYRDDLLSQLQIRVDRDSRMGGSSVGPHRDDLQLNYNDQLLSQYGSRGENRSTMLAMTLAELEYLKKNSTNPPILLLDDVLSELDDTRARSLISAIKGVQTIITSTHELDVLGKYEKIDLSRGYSSKKDQNKESQENNG